MGFFLHQHQLGVQEFSSILTLPVRPTVKVLVPQGCPHFGCQSHVPRPLILLTDEQISQGFPYDLSNPSSGLTICCCCCQVISVVSNSVRPHRWQPIRLIHPWDSLGENTGVGCHFLLQCMKVKSESEVSQSCPTFRYPMDCAYEVPLSMGFSRQEYWSGSPLPSLDNLLEYLKESCVLSCVQLFVTPWTVVRQAPLSLGFSSVQLSSVAPSCPTLCNPIDCCTSGFPVHHQLPEFAQTHVH